MTFHRNGTLMDEFHSGLGMALRSFIVYEIGYGGHVTALEEDRIQVTTQVRRKTDVTEFKGTRDEITPFRVFCRYFQWAHEHVGGVVRDKVWSMISDKNGQCKPLIAASLSPLLHGYGVSRVALLGAIGDIRCSDESDIDTLMEVEQKTRGQHGLKVLAEVFAGCYEHQDLTLQDILTCCEV